MGMVDAILCYCHVTGSRQYINKHVTSGDMS